MGSSKRDWSDLVRLGDFIQITHGWPFKSQYFSEELTGRPIVVNIGNFEYTGGFRFSSTTVKEYRGDYPREYELRPRDILLVMTCQTAGGEILGIPGRIPNDGRTYLHNQRLGKVVIKEPDRIVPDFLYWLFLWPEFNRELFMSASGSKILHTSPKRIEAFRFRLPPIRQQQVIADILGTLDDKIELNRRMNRVLEEMARAIFKAWFVDFEPVRAKAAGARGFPGMPQDVFDALPDSFVDSELGPIPKGWEVGAIGSLCEFKYGKSLKAADRHGGSVPVYGSNGVVGFHDEPLTQGPGIVIGRKGNPGTVIWVHDSFFPIDTTFYVVPKRREVPLAYLRYALDFIGLAGYGSDSAVPGLSRKIAYGLPLLVPDSMPLVAFESKFLMCQQLIAAAKKESETLATLRDTLLPKLISGEIAVPAEAVALAD